MAVLQGRVFDASGALLPGARVTMRGDSTGFAVSVRSGPDGRYSIVAIPAGTYTVEAEAIGLRPELIEELIVEVGRTLVRDFYLSVGGRNETIVVRAELPLLDRATSVVGHMVSAQTIQEIPLNGRHYIDLGLLVPGRSHRRKPASQPRPLAASARLASTQPVIARRPLRFLSTA